MICKNCKKRESRLNRVCCSNCAELQRIYYRGHRDIKLAKQKRYRSLNREKIRVKSKEQHLAYRYGISLQDIENLLKAQDNHCAICPATKPGGSGEWHVDHFHVNGYDVLPPKEKCKYVRGLLCYRCNVGIGLLGDDPTLLRAAVAYLERRLRCAPAAEERP